MDIKVMMNYTGLNLFTDHKVLASNLSIIPKNECTYNITSLDKLLKILLEFI